MSTTNINGTPGRTSYQAVFGVDSNLPFGNPISPIFSAPVADIASGLNIGDQTNVNSFVGFYKDRAPNDASGYNTLGVPTFGDGRKNTVTTFNPDFSADPASGNFVYNTPLGPTRVLFSSLT